MTKRVPYPQNVLEKIDRSGDCWEWTGGRSLSGYGRATTLPGLPRSQAHRAVYEILVGPIPDGMQLDHICHNPGCVRPEHLRPATQKQNNENRVVNKSVYRGVYFYERTGRWRAQVTHLRRAIHLGYFDSPEEAATAAAAKRLELFTYNDHDRQAVAV